MIARPLNACISVARHTLKRVAVFALVEESKDQQRCPYDKQVCRLTYLSPSAIFLYPLKTSETLKDFLIYEGL